MNPFVEGSHFDPRLYGIVSRISKRSDRTKLEGLRELSGVLGSVDVEANLDALLEVVEKTLRSQDMQIRNASADVLYGLLSSVPDRSRFRRALSIWLYGFIESPGHGASRKIFAEFVSVEELEDELVAMLDFKEDPAVGLTCLLLLARKGKGKRSYAKVLADNVKYLSLSSAKELGEVYRVCMEVGKVEGLYEKVVMAKGPSAMNAKWKLLLDVFDAVPECIASDGKYLDCEVLSRVVERLSCCDNVPVRGVEALRVVFPKVRDRRRYLKEYLSHGSIGGLCILEFVDDFRFLNENVSFETVNRLVANVLRIHCGSESDVLKMVEGMGIGDGTRDVPASGSREKDRTVHRCSSSGCEDRKEVFKTLLSSMDGLRGKEKIVRADVLGMSLDPNEFSREEIEEVLLHSVNVFPKEEMLGMAFEGNVLPLVLKYPADVGEERIRRAVNKDNIHLFIPVCTDLELVRSLVFCHDDRSVLEIYLSSDTPWELDLDFYYRLGDKIDKPRAVDGRRVVSEYLEGGFVKKLISEGVVERAVLYDAAIGQLCSLCLPMNTSYTDGFYDLDECFYRDVEPRSSARMVLGLMDVYVEVYEGPSEAFLLLVLDAMCGDEDGALDCKLRRRGVSGGKQALADEVLSSKDVVEKWKGVCMGKNKHFVERVLCDLGLPFERCSNKTLEELLDMRGPRAVDYVIRKHNVPLQFVAFADFSYLSDEALSRAVGGLQSAFSNRFPADITGLSLEGQGHSLDTGEDAVDDNLLMSLVRSNFRCLETLDAKDVVRMIERDRLLSGKEFYRRRLAIYLPLLRSLYSHMADSMLNMYSISRLDVNSVDGEVYGLLRECLLGSEALFWDFLLNTMLIVRNTSVNAFVERMVREKEEWEGFVESADLEQRSLFAFVFPNIFCTLPRMEVSLDSLIEREASRAIMDVAVKAQKLTNGFDVRIAYTAGGAPFTALVTIPSDYPYKKPTFSSDVGKKSLLDLKINEMIKKSSKFMELVGMWKINIDEKMSGHKECPICYFIIDMHDSSFPTTQCSTCKNKFHPRCIVKWVASGTRSTCPICRRPMESIEGKSRSFAAQS